MKLSIKMSLLKKNTKHFLPDAICAINFVYVALSSIAVKTLFLQTDEATCKIWAPGHNLL